MSTDSPEKLVDTKYFFVQKLKREDIADYFENLLETKFVINGPVRLFQDSDNKQKVVLRELCANVYSKQCAVRYHSFHRAAEMKWTVLDKIIVAIGCKVDIFQPFLASLANNDYNQALRRVCTLSDFQPVVGVVNVSNG